MSRYNSNLVYTNKLANCKRKPMIEMLDKITEGIYKNTNCKLKATPPNLIKIQ